MVASLSNPSTTIPRPRRSFLSSRGCKGKTNFLILQGVASALAENPTLACYNNLEPTTYQNGAMSGKSDFHVDISKFPRGEFLFSTWGRKNSSEESNETSEEMNHAHVENKKYPRGDLRFPTWIFENRD